MVNIEDTLTRGVAQILPSKNGLADLMKKRKITLYQGFDPSMPSLHLGNLVGLMKLRQFQKLGHQVIFLVGDFTGMIGDPTDKSAARKKLTREEVAANALHWKEQIARVLNLEGENAARIQFNSEWSDPINFKDLIEITSNFTVQQLIERDMFQQRLKENRPIFLHEFLYPVAQGYDSVAMDVDLEIGGNDQVFNMLAGRSLMKSLKGKDKYVLSTKLLVDKEGSKVGKTTGNALFLDVSAQDFYGGIMSFPDETIALSFELLTETDLKGIEEKIKQDPLGEKKRLAYELVKFLYSDEAARQAEKHFVNTFQKKETPTDTGEIRIEENTPALLDLVFHSKLVPSRSEAKRLIQQGAVEVGSDIITDPLHEVQLDKKGIIVKIGKKRFIKFILK